MAVATLLCGFPQQVCVCPFRPFSHPLLGARQASRLVWLIVHIPIFLPRCFWQRRSRTGSKEAEGSLGSARSAALGSLRGVLLAELKFF